MQLGVRAIILSLVLWLKVTAAETTKAAANQIQTLLAGKELQLKATPTVARTKLFRVDGHEIFCEFGPSRWYPLDASVAGMKVVKVTSGASEEIVGRKRIEDGRRIEYRSITIPVQTITLTLNHPQLGKGKIKLYEADSGSADPKSFATVLRHLFNGINDDVLPDFVGNPESMLFHYKGSGHSVDGRDFLTASEADTAGFKRCPICFVKVQTLPYLGQEMAIQSQMVSMIRSASRTSTNVGLQERTEKLGAKVLNGWPVQKKGYSYRFTVIEGKSLRAFACPAGEIFIPEAVLQSLETDDEVEAFLAREVAHIELRHALATYLARQRAANAAAIVSAVASAGAAAAAVNNNVDARVASNVANGVGLFAYVVTAEIMTSGFSVEHEKQADFFAAAYLARSKRSLNGLRNILLKHRSVELLEGISGQFGNRLAPVGSSRLFAIDSLSCEFFETPVTFDYFDSEDEPICSLTILGTASQSFLDGSKKTLLLTEVETFAGLDDPQEVSLLRVRSGSGMIEFTPEESSMIAPLSTSGVIFKSERSSKLNFGDAPTISGIGAKASSRRH